MKNNRDEIIKICDELEYDKKITIYNYKQIKSTKNILENHINDNYDNYLKLKAELDIHLKFNETSFSNLAFIFSFFSLVTTIAMNVFNIWVTLKWDDSINEMGYNTILFNLFLLIILLIITSLLYCNYSKNAKREKWLSYIKYSLEDIEQEFKPKKRQ